MVEEKEDRFTLFKQGDERIFRQYYEKYYHALCLWVVRIIKEETRMHDIVQEAFIVLWNSRMIIESELHLKMFLYQVVRNRCFNYLKSKRVEEKYIQEYLQMEEEGGFEDTVLEEEVHRIVAQEIEKLPEEQRKVVYFHMEGKNNLEIAEIMQISVNTVKTHKARARKTLKNKIIFSLSQSCWDCDNFFLFFYFPCHSLGLFNCIIVKRAKSL